MRPAFPVYKGGYTSQPGMSLRDYFAAQALTALMHIEAAPASYASPALPTWYAARAYQYADAMLKAREP